MTFFGVQKSLTTWRSIIASRLGATCGPIRQEDDVRFSFQVELTQQERELLQDQYWYAVEPGQDLRWNDRIAFSEK